MSNSQKKETRCDNSAALSGRVVITLYDAQKSTIKRRMESSNLIVGDGVEAMLYLIAQNSGDPSASSFAVTSLRLGTGTTPPTDADKSLESEIYAVNFGVGEKLVVPANREVIFSHTLGTADGNGYQYAEAGLVMRDAALPTFSKLFARYVHPPYAKTIGVQAVYEWHVSIRTSSN